MMAFLASAAAAFLLLLAGLSLAGTAVAFVACMPLFVVFSPVLVPAGITATVLASVLMAGGTSGVTAFTIFLWLYKQLTGKDPPKIPGVDAGGATPDGGAAGGDASGGAAPSGDAPGGDASGGAAPSDATLAPMKMEKPTAKPKTKMPPKPKSKQAAKPTAKPTAKPKAIPAVKPKPKAKPAVKPKPKAKPAVKPKPKAKPAAKPKI